MKKNVEYGQSVLKEVNDLDAAVAVLKNDKAVVIEHNGNKYVLIPFENYNDNSDYLVD